jgi:hypothetical protein
MGNMARATKQKRRSKSTARRESDARRRAGVEFNRDIERARVEFQNNTGKQIHLFLGRVEDAAKDYGLGEENAFIRAVTEAADRFKVLVDEEAEELKSAARVAVAEFDEAATELASNS